MDDVKESRGYWKLEEETMEVLYGQLTLEGVMDLSSVRLLNEWLY